MEIFHIDGHQVASLSEMPKERSAQGFLWIDATHDEVLADPVAWREAIERATGVHVFDLHLSDAINLSHPSYFDSTRDYAMVVFRKLALSPVTDREADNGAVDDTAIVQHTGTRRKLPPAVGKLATQPVTFLLMECALVTVHAMQSRTIEVVRQRLHERSARPPASPGELLLRLLNGMVDQYLALRQPLTGQIDRWQRALLNPRHMFNDWMALLDARVELRKLDQLCEGQHDALQELRDFIIDSDSIGSNSGSKDLLLVRVNDVMEHITRVLNHARRLESTIESAVQLHFSAMAHKTSEIMRTLTVITALFMPLTLITGIFGMNFNDMPLLKDKAGFWITMSVMAGIVAILLFFFRRKRYLEDQGPDNGR